MWQDFVNSGYSCNENEGDDEKMLSDDRLTSKCESLCLQQADGDGCCSIVTGKGCYWKRGSFAISTGGISLAVNCTVNAISEFSIASIISVFFHLISKHYKDFYLFYL